MPEDKGVKVTLSQNRILGLYRVHRKDGVIIRREIIETGKKAKPKKKARPKNGADTWPRR